MTVEEWITEGKGLRSATFNMGVVYLLDYVNGRIVFTVAASFENALMGLAQQIERDAIQAAPKEESTGN